MRRQDQVVTKAELLDRVWDASGGHRSQRRRGSTSATFVARSIRPFGLRTLQTVRGAGYRLVDEALAAEMPIGV